MTDILEFIEDLEQLEAMADTPMVHTAIENMLKDYKERAYLMEKDMERQAELF